MKCKVKCKALAHNLIYWRGINADIDNMLDKCDICLTYRNNPNKEPQIPHEIPEQPFQKVAADIFMLYGNQYHIILDYFSKWPEILKLPNYQTSNIVITYMKKVFSCFGILEVIFLDNERIYTSTEFNKFYSTYDIRNEFSSAQFSQSNGQVERCIQSIKKMMKKCIKGNNDFDLALLQYRVAPLKKINT